MSQINVVEDTGSYRIIAWANNQEVVYYHEFGSYQGDWAMVTRDEKNYYIWKGSYGSCSGCDSLQDADPQGLEAAKKFSADYQPFLEIPRETMMNLAISGNLKEVFSANHRDEYSDMSVDEVCSDTMLHVKLIEGIDITPKDILACKNAELKQKTLKNFGYENFLNQVVAETLDSEGENHLVKIDDIVFASVKDSSTARRYLLRVPPGVKKIREAIAWTFGLEAHEYHPLIET